MRFKLALAALLGCTLSTTGIQADNWNPWRGPDGSGSAADTDVPLTWSNTENVLWKVSIPGKGSSTPITWGNKVFVLTAVPTDRKKEDAGTEPQPSQNEGGRRRGGPAPTNYYQFIVLCFDKDSGEKIWEQIATEEVPHEAGHQTNTFASSSVVTDGQQIYVDFGSRGIYCYDMDGNKKWNVDLGEMRTRAAFGEGSTPAVHDDTLIVPWDHEAGSMLYALDAKTGKEKWKVTREESTTWATPLIVEHKGVVQVITNGMKVRSYDIKDGSLIWECGGQVANPIPTPVLFGDHVICMTGFRGDKIQSISLDAKGDVSDSPMIAWSRNDAAPYVPSPVLYKGTLYFCKQNNALVSSVDAKTGEVLMKPTRVNGLDTLYSSPVAAADRIYFTGRDGTTVVIKHAPELEILATNTLGETVDSSIAISNGKFYIRSESTLYCIGNK